MAARLNGMMQKCSNLFRGLINPRFISRRGFAMDDDGDLTPYKTSVTILNQEQDRGIFIDSYSSLGFLLSSGIRVIGPCAVFPRSVLQWNVRSIHQVNEDSLALFTMLEPKIDILVLGVGERDNLSKIDPNIIKHLRLNKINVEILPTQQYHGKRPGTKTETLQNAGRKAFWAFHDKCCSGDQALATFNFLNSEKRYVAGAFIPPSYIISMTDDEITLDPSMGRMSEHEFPGYDDDDFTPIMERSKEVMLERQKQLEKKKSSPDQTKPDEF